MLNVKASMNARRASVDATIAPTGASGKLSPFFCIKQSLKPDSMQKQKIKQQRTKIIHKGIASITLRPNKTPLTTVIGILPFQSSADRLRIAPWNDCLLGRD
ncbi:MAG TPA: hypothetical protein V6C72_11650, partial [Chroococcales cyanobacterium]